MRQRTNEIWLAMTKIYCLILKRWWFIRRDIYSLDANKWWLLGRRCCSRVTTYLDDKADKWNDYDKLLRACWCRTKFRNGTVMCLIFFMRTFYYEPASAIKIAPRESIIMNIFLTEFCAANLIRNVHMYISKRKTRAPRVRSLYVCFVCRSLTFLSY